MIQTLNRCFVLLSQESWLTGQASTSTSSSLAVSSSPRPACSSWCLFRGWIKGAGRRRSSINRPRRPNLPLTSLPAVSTAACPQRETKTRPRLTGRSISPASELLTLCVALNTSHSGSDSFVDYSVMFVPACVVRQMLQSFLSDTSADLNRPDVTGRCHLVRHKSPNKHYE